MIEEKDEWTIVSSKQNTSRRGRQKHSCSSKKAEKQYAKGRALMKSLNDDNDGVNYSDNHHGDEAIYSSHKESLYTQLTNCMEALECISGGDGITFDLDALLSSLCGNLSISTTTSADDERDAFLITEIVCYGIGNFVPKSTSSSSSAFLAKIHSSPFSPPMIQLACVLVLRRKLAQLRKHHQPRNFDDKNSSQNIMTSKTTESETIELSYDEQQELVNMVYFEPCIKQIERAVLEEYFSVTILNTNERGKRTVSAALIDDFTLMPDHGSRDGKTCTTDKDERKKLQSSTLFYMPHCPMRLYSNVLWANWDKNLLTSGRLLILGNSFCAYDDRVIGTDRRNDPTNGIFRLMPFVREVLVLTGSRTSSSHPNGVAGVAGRHKKKKKGSFNMMLKNTSLSTPPSLSLTLLTQQNLEMAFNDCVITYFSANSKESRTYTAAKEKQEDLGIVWPERPLEHIMHSPSDDSGSSIILQHDSEVI